MYCKCWERKLSIGKALFYIVDEIGEFLSAPSFDEASDIAFAVGRFLGVLIGKDYVNIPGDFLTLKKLQYRMLLHGCIQSKRHLSNGRCPSE